MVLTVLHAPPTDGAHRLHALPTVGAHRSPCPPTEGAHCSPYSSYRWCSLFSIRFLQMVLTVLHALPTVGAHRSPCSSYRRCSLFADNICFCFVFYHVKSLEVYQEENSWKFSTFFSYLFKAGGGVASKEFAGYGGIVESGEVFIFSPNKLLNLSPRDGAICPTFCSAKYIWTGYLS